MGALVLNNHIWTTYEQFLRSVRFKHMNNITNACIYQNVMIFCCGAFDSETVEIIRCLGTTSFYDGKPLLCFRHKSNRFACNSVEIPTLDQGLH